MFTPTYDVMYHVHEIVGGTRKPKLMTESYMEAEAWFKDGCIVYEVHTTKFSTEWITSMTQTYYEWH